MREALPEILSLKHRLWNVRDSVRDDVSIPNNQLKAEVEALADAANSLLNDVLRRPGCLSEGAAPYPRLLATTQQRSRSRSDTPRRNGRRNFRYDTIRALSLQFGVPISSIVRANKLLASYHVDAPLPPDIDLRIPNNPKETFESEQVAVRRQWIGMTSHDVMTDSTRGIVVPKGTTMNEISAQFRIPNWKIQQLNPFLAGVDPDARLAMPTHIVLASFR